MWFGTADGLNRYDGYDFIVYRHNPADTNSIANNTVRRITEDAAGNLWLRTGSNIDRFDRVAGIFHHYPPQFQRILITEDGHLWASGLDGLYQYNQEQDLFEKKWSYQLPEESPPVDTQDNRPLGLFEDTNGLIWVSTSAGYLMHFDRKSDQRRVYVLPWDFTIVDGEDHVGRLFILHDQGVGFFDPANGTFGTDPTISPTTPTISVAQSQTQQYWFASTRLYQFDPNLGSGKFVSLDDNEETHLANTVWDIYEDPSGALWVGTLNGVYRTDPHIKPFFHVSHDPGNPNSLSNNVVMSLLRASDDQLWVGTLGSGIDLISLDSGYARHFKINETGCDNLIWALYVTGQTLWAGTNRGLCALDIRSETFAHWLLDSEQPFNPIHVIQQDDQGMMWLGGSTNLFKLNPRTGASTAYKEALTATGGGSRISGLKADEKGSLWIGTTTYDLYQLDLSTEKVTHFRTPGGDELKDGEGLWEIIPDPSGGLWIGSDRGLFFFNTSTGKFVRFGKNAGFPSDFVYSLRLDASGFIWVSTNAGLVRFKSPVTDLNQIQTSLDSLQIYQAGDGIGNTEFNRRAAFNGADGRLYFGGTEGITFFDPLAIKANPHIPPVVVTNIQISNPDSTRNVNPFGLEALQLNHRDYSVAFEFAGLSYTQSTQNQYAYRMRGVDPDWQLAGTRRFSQYTNLKAGHYTLQVKAANNDGVWNEAGFSLPIYVAPPFWQTWWFVTITGLALLTTLVGLIRFISTRKLRKQLRALEIERGIQHERERISRDLHDNVGAQLTTIISGVELMRLSTKAGNTSALTPYLDAVDRDSKKTLSQLRETIWTLQKDQISIGELHHQLREYLKNLQPYHPAIRMIINPDQSTAWVLSPTAALGLFRIVQEAVNNAIKHAGCTEIRVNLHATAEVLNLSVSDDGTFKHGHKETDLEGIGLTSIKQRVREMGGTFKIDTSSGTTVLVSVPKAAKV